MTSSKTDRGLKRKQQIVQAAHSLFIRQGFHGTSMRQIARQAHIALGGLYNHFENKEAVFQAVFLEHHPYREVLPRLMAAAGLSIEDFVRNAAESLAEAVARRPEFLNLMFIEAVEFRGKHTQMLFDEIFPTIQELVEKITDSQKERLRQIPPLMLIRAFLGLFVGYYFTEKVYSGYAADEFSQNSMDYFVNIFLHGVLSA